MVLREGWVHVVFCSDKEKMRREVDHIPRVDGLFPVFAPTITHVGRESAPDLSHFVSRSYTASQGGPSQIPGRTENYKASTLRA